MLLHGHASANSINSCVWKGTCSTLNYSHCSAPPKGLVACLVSTQKDNLLGSDKRVPEVSLSPKEIGHEKI